MSKNYHQTIRTRLKIGDTICDRFQIVDYLGSGWQSDVFLVTEIVTGIDRTAKVFHPKRNFNNKVAISHAKKLHRTRFSSSLVQYLFQEVINIDNERMTCLISEYIQGEVLEVYLNRQKQLPVFEALHIVKSIAEGLSPLHSIGEYHGDLHSANIIINRVGLNYNIKLLDPFDWKDGKKLNIQKDVIDLIRILYDLCGGRNSYNKLPREIKSICCGLKHSLIVKKFPTSTALLAYLNRFEWSNK